MHTGLSSKLIKSFAGMSGASGRRWALTNLFFFFFFSRLLHGLPERFFPDQARQVCERKRNSFFSIMVRSNPGRSSMRSGELQFGVRAHRKPSKVLPNSVSRAMPALRRGNRLGNAGVVASPRKRRQNFHRPASGLTPIAVGPPAGEYPMPKRIFLFQNEAWRARPEPVLQLAVNNHLQRFCPPEWRPPRGMKSLRQRVTGVSQWIDERFGSADARPAGRYFIFFFAANPQEPPRCFMMHGRVID